MAVRNAPRSPTQLANMEIAVRSDFAAWCEGFRNVCEQLSLLALGLHDELYMRLAGNHGGSYAARAKARAAVRPLRFLAQAANATGRLAPAAFRHYQRKYADEISPDRRKRTFDHTK